MLKDRSNPLAPASWLQKIQGTIVMIVVSLIIYACAAFALFLTWDGLRRK